VAGYFPASRSNFIPHHRWGGGGFWFWEKLAVREGLVDEETFFGGIRNSAV